MAKVHDRLNKQRTAQHWPPTGTVSAYDESATSLFSITIYMKSNLSQKTADAMPDEDDWAEQKLCKSNYSLGGKSSVSSSSRAKILCLRVLAMRHRAKNKIGETISRNIKTVLGRQLFAVISNSKTPRGKEESRAKYFLSFDRPRSGFVLITPLNWSGLRIQAGSRTSVPRLARLSKPRSTSDRRKQFDVDAGDVVKIVEIRSVRNAASRCQLIAALEPLEKVIEEEEVNLLLCLSRYC